MSWSNIKKSLAPKQGFRKWMREHKQDRHSRSNCPKGEVWKPGIGNQKGKCVPEKEQKIDKIPVKKPIRPVASEEEMKVLYREEKDFLSKLKNQVESHRNQIEGKVKLVKGIMEIEDETLGRFKKFPSKRKFNTKKFDANRPQFKHRSKDKPIPKAMNKNRYYKGQQRFLDKIIQHINARIEKVSKFEGVKGCMSCNVGKLSIMQRWLNSLPTPNWKGKFGGIPTTPGYPESPTTCPLSIRTNLKRIFFSGVNLLNKLNSMISSGQTQQALQYLQSLKPSWKQWLSEVDRLHGGKSKQHKYVIKFFDALMEYLFNYNDPRKFAEDFSKVAIFAYDNY